MGVAKKSYEVFILLVKFENYSNFYSPEGSCNFERMSPVLQILNQTRSHNRGRNPRLWLLIKLIYVTRNANECLCQVIHLLTLYFVVVVVVVVVIFLFQRSLYNWFLYFCFCFQPKCLECVKPLFSFQVLVAIILLPVKRSCSRFSTSEEIIIPSS